LKLDHETKQRSLKHEQSIIDSGNVNKLFSSVKNKLKFNQGIGPIENELGNLACDNQEKAKMFSDQFSVKFLPYQTMKHLASNSNQQNCY